MEHAFPSAETILDKAKKERPLTLEAPVVASFGDLCSSLRSYLRNVYKAKLMNSAPGYNDQSVP